MAPERRWPTGPRTVFFGDAAARSTLAAARRAGEITRLAVGTWTADTVSAPSEVVAANLWRIVAHHCPDAVVVDRTAARGGRIDSGVITVATDSRVTPLALPGVTVLVRPLVRHPSDTPWSHDLTGSAPARTLVDNLTETHRRKGRPGRTLTRAELGDWLASKLIAWGEERFDQLRAGAVYLTAELGSGDGATIEALCGEVSGKGPLRYGTGGFTRAVRAGTAWDRRRLALFTEAARSLAELDPQGFPAPVRDGELPFFEAYFSNYIEGTEFSIESAREIVETQTPPARRAADGHDILGTHRCVTDPVGRAHSPTGPGALIEVLRARHESVMVGRPDTGPGELKVEENRIGSVPFVAPSLVEGTLVRGLGLLDDLPAGLARAILVMLVVTEVHPFADGNGRTARLMMNAELSAVGQCRIVVPTIQRNEYVSSLRRASTNDGDIRPLEAVLTHAWRWSAAMPWADRAATDAQLAATHALVDPTDAENESLHLTLP